jgi:hypothetical protein
MKHLFVSIVILTLLFNLPAYAQKSRRRSKSKPTPSQSSEKPCAPVDYYNYPKTEAQQRNVNKLASDLIAIEQNAPLTPVLLNLITNDLIDVADDATKVETELLKNLAENLAKAISSRKIPNKIKSQIAEDTWMALNVTTFRSASVSANARIGEQLYKFGVNSTTLDNLRDAFNSITNTVGRNIP